MQRNRDYDRIGVFQSLKTRTKGKDVIVPKMPTVIFVMPIWMGNVRQARNGFGLRFYPLKSLT